MLSDEELAESILHRLNALDTREDQREFIKAELAAIREECAKELEKVAFLHGNDKWRERKIWQEAADHIRTAQPAKAQEGA
jgi:hypothetical protein